MCNMPKVAPILVAFFAEINEYENGDIFFLGPLLASKSNVLTLKPLHIYNQES